MRLILVRHGQTRLNREGRAQGHTRLGLDGTGQRQAAQVAEALKEEAVTALYASPLPRAMETARVIGRRLGLEVKSARSLIELDIGELDGLSFEELNRRYPDLMEVWRLNPAEAVMPGGETLAHVQRRAWRSALRLLGRHPGETVVAVSHNFVIQAILCKALAMPLNHFRRLRVDVGSMTILSLERPKDDIQAIVETVNHRPGLTVREERKGERAAARSN